MGLSCIKERDEPQSSPARTVPDIRRWSQANLGSNGLTIGTSNIEINNIRQLEPSIVTQMMEEWNNMIGGLTFFNTPSSDITNREYPNHLQYGRDNEFGIYWHSTWFSNISTSALAITTFRGVQRQSGTPDEWVEILHADIVVNGLHSFSTDPNDTAAYHLPSVLLHELGHFIGLLHITGREAVMAPSLSRFDSYDTPFVADDDALQGLYSSYTNPIVGTGPNRKGVRFRPKKESQIVEGWIELHTDGECRHYQNGRLVEKHSHPPEHFKH